MESTVNDKLNIMVIGDEEVGKTTILERYFHRKFNSERKKTIGVEYFSKTHRDSNSNISYNIKFWDTAGQERFHSITKNYFKRAQGMIITLAINKKSSFLNLKMWINSIIDGSSTTEIPIVVLCNKCDLEEEREVQNSEIEKFCKEEKLRFFYTSAKNGNNIDEAFEHILKEVVKKNIENSVNDKSVFIDDKKEKSNKKCC